MSWDSWEHARALALFEPDPVKDQLRVVPDHTSAAGMVPDVMNSDSAENNWRDTKPTLAAWAVAGTFQETADRGWSGKPDSDGLQRVRGGRPISNPGHGPSGVRSHERWLAKPVWLDQAYLAVVGLERYGFLEDAEEFRSRLLDGSAGLTGETPIFANYHSMSEKGLNALHFSRSAAHYLLLLKRGRRGGMDRKRSLPHRRPVNQSFSTKVTFMLTR